MTAQRLINVLLTLFVCIHYLVYSEILAQDDHVSEGESGTESVTKMEDINLSDSEIPTVDITNTAGMISSSTSTITTHPSSIHNNIELIDRVELLLLRSTELLLLLEKLQVFLTNLSLLQRHQLQTSYVTSTTTTSKPLTISIHRRRKMKKKKPSKVSPKIHKGDRKCKDDRKLEDQIKLPLLESTTQLPPLNIKMHKEEEYFKRDDPWRYQVYRCWIHRACHFGW